MNSSTLLRPLPGSALLFPIMPSDVLGTADLEDADRVVTQGRLIYPCLGMDEGTRIVFPAGCESAFREEAPGDWRPLAFLEDRVPGDVLVVPEEKILASFVETL